MTIRTLGSTASALALALASWVTTGTVQGQPMYDRINVSLPYAVQVGDRTLQPGDYTIQQLPDSGGASRILLVYSDNGMRFETSAMTIPALDVNTARDTKLILDKVGSNYYLNKVWVQGKDYGYELPLPDSVKSRQKEEIAETTLPARSQTTSETTSQTTTTTGNAASSTTASNAAATEESKASTAVPTPQPEQEVARNTPPPQPETAQPSTPDNTANREATDQNNTANRAMDDRDNASSRKMPSTSAGWLTLLLGGGLLSGAGTMLRRKH